MSMWADNIKFVKDILDGKYKKIDDAVAEVFIQMIHKELPFVQQCYSPFSFSSLHSRESRKKKNTVKMTFCDPYFN